MTEHVQNPQNVKETFTVEFLFHSGTHLPIADINTLSADPFIYATLVVPALPLTHDEPPLSWRSPTIRRTRDPTWDCKWRVSGVPTSGCQLVLRLKDEDPGDRDDRLGKGHLDLHDIREGFELKEHEVTVRKRKGSLIPYLTTYLAAVLPGQRLILHPRIIVSVRVIGKDTSPFVNKAYTNGPNKFTQHFSPLIGRMVLSSTGKEEDDEGKKRVATSSFIAHKLQLTGPVPPELRHRFVPYKAFIGWLFHKSGVLGRILNTGLRKQYRTIYSYDKQTVYGVVEPSDYPIRDDEQRQELSRNMASQFLEFTNYGEGARIYTYVITLDAEWRFTETGEEFGIDLLSKHSMHADLAKEIAFSGEFFVRKRKKSSGIDVKHKDEQGATQETIQDKDPKDYELVIDNDSGTYRPKKELLPKFQEYLAGDACLGGLGAVITMDGFDETLKKWKDKRKEEKKELKKDGGKVRLATSASSSSISSVSTNELGEGPSINEKEIKTALAGAKGNEVTTSSKGKEHESEETEGDIHTNGSVDRISSPPAKAHGEEIQADDPHTA